MRVRWWFDRNANGEDRVTENGRNIILQFRRKYKIRLNRHTFDSFTKVIRTYIVIRTKTFVNRTKCSISRTDRKRCNNIHIYDTTNTYPSNVEKLQYSNDNVLRCFGGKTHAHTHTPIADTRKNVSTASALHTLPPKTRQIGGYNASSFRGTGAADNV
jgi:hypothetical protein